MANSVAQYLMAHARQYGLDPRAVLAIARQEGLSGGVGDHGTSFGPFQLHEGGALPRGIAPGRAQAWATSPAGMNYALSRMSQVARGLHGSQAISAISRRFERPANPAAEIAGAIRDYGAGAGSSPAVSAVSKLMASVGGGDGQQAGANPRQLMSQYLLQEAQSQLTGQTNNVADEGQGLLQMALMRKALQSSGGGSAGGGSTGMVRGGGQSMPGGGFAGGFLPKGALYQPGRKDQGRDGSTNPGGALRAPGNGYVVAVKSDPHGFGPAYPIVHFTSGRYKGQDIYLGHTISTLSPGAKFSAGTVLSHTGTHGIGNATVPGWFEIGYAPGGMPGTFGQSTPF